MIEHIWAIDEEFRQLEERASRLSALRPSNPTREWQLQARSFRNDILERMQAIIDERDCLLREQGFPSETDDISEGDGM